MGMYQFATIKQQNSYSISHLLGTVTTQWLESDSVVTVAGSTVTTRFINYVVTVLPEVNNGNYTIIVRSLCLVGDWWNRSFDV